MIHTLYLCLGSPAASATAHDHPATQAPRWPGCSEDEGPATLGLLGSNRHMANTSYVCNMYGMDTCERMCRGGYMAV